MKGQIKKKRIKEAVIATIVAVAAFVVFMLITEFAMFKKIAGPMDLNDLKVSEYDNQYVTMNMDCVLDLYMGWTSGSSSNIVSKEYIVINDKDVLMGVHISKKSRMAQAEEIIKSTYEYWNGEKAQLDKSMNITGSLRKMDFEEQKYFKSVLQEDHGLTLMEILDISAFYVIDDGHIGTYDNKDMYIHLAVTAAGLLVVIYFWLRIFSKKQGKGIDDFLNEHQELSIEHIESDMLNAEVFKNIRIGRRFTFYINSTGGHVIENSKMLWMYHERLNNRNGTTHNLVIYVSQTNAVRIPISKQKVIEDIIEYYGKMPDAPITGYSEELQNLFHTNHQEFLERLSQKRRTLGGSYNYGDSGQSETI